MIIIIISLMAVLIPNAFNGLSIRPHASLPTDFVYFSYVTLTTVGYGEIIHLSDAVIAEKSAVDNERLAAAGLSA